MLPTNNLVALAHDLIENSKKNHIFFDQNTRKLRILIDSTNNNHQIIRKCFYYLSLDKIPYQKIKTNYEFDDGIVLSCIIPHQLQL